MRLLSTIALLLPVPHAGTHDPRSASNAKRRHKDAKGRPDRPVDAASGARFCSPAGTTGPFPFSVPRSGWCSGRSWRRPGTGCSIRWPASGWRCRTRPAIPSTGSLGHWIRDQFVLPDPNLLRRPFMHDTLGTTRRPTNFGQGWPARTGRGDRSAVQTGDAAS